jgi:predicted phage tail protein
MQQTVRLLGDLGERYGSEHKYHDLRSPADALKLLCINKPELAKELAEAHKHNIGYTLVQAGEFLDYEDLRLPLGRNDLILTPVVAGSGGGGVGKILIGVALVAVAIVAAPLGAGFLGLGAGAFTATTGTALVAGTATSFATTALLSAVSVALGTLGTGLILTGVSQVLSPQPVIPSLNDRTRPGQNTNATGPQGVSRAVSGEQSYAFAGPANTVGIGATIPLVYGKMLIGSNLISSTVDVTNESDPTSEFFVAPGPSSVTVNSDKVTNRFANLNGLRTRRWADADIRIEDDQGSRGYNRRIYNSSLDFSDTGGSIEAGGLRNWGGSNDEEIRQNLQIFFQLDRGLSRTIGLKLVPAFLTYEITVEKTNYSGTSPIFSRVQGTIQGLLTQTDRFKWAHAITYGQSGAEDNDTEVLIKVRIVKTDAEPNQRISLLNAGYEYFFDDDQNYTENLVGG